MTIIEKIKSFLDTAEDISIGFSSISFIKTHEFDKGQVGYSIDIFGNSLVTGQEGDWEESWVVLGSDALGDPIFTDCSIRELPVFTSQHGEGTWQPILISDTLDNFQSIISDLKQLSINRQSPNELETNPISEEQLHNFYSKLKNHHDNIEIWWWEAFFA